MKKLISGGLLALIISTSGLNASFLNLAVEDPNAPGWYELGWFGRFYYDSGSVNYHYVNATDGWRPCIYHDKHGWMPFQLHGADGAWLWLQPFGKVYSKPGHSEWTDTFLSAGGQSFNVLVYVTSSSNPVPRFFMLDGSGTWLQISTMGPVPFWWMEQGLISLNSVPESQAPLTIGQLKNICLQAKYYLDDRLENVGGAGRRVNNFVSLFYNFSANQPYNSDENSKPATAGQVASAANVFYRRLQEVGVDTHSQLQERINWEWEHTVPWNVWSAEDALHSTHPATVGQAKMAFSFYVHPSESLRLPLRFTDTNSNGIPDLWEWIWLGGLQSNPHLDTHDQDGMTLIQEFWSGTNPMEKDHPDVELTLF